MNRFGHRVLATSAIAALSVGLGFGAVGATAAGASTPVRHAKVGRAYSMGVNWAGGGYEPDTLVLYGNHTGSDSFGTTVTWASTGRNYTITFSADGVTAIFVGVKNKAGFDKVKKPGTMTNDLGNSGTWYAIRTS